MFLRLWYELMSYEPMIARTLQVYATMTQLTLHITSTRRERVANLPSCDNQQMQKINLILRFGFNGSTEWFQWA